MRIVARVASAYLRKKGFRDWKSITRVLAETIVEPLLESRPDLAALSKELSSVPAARVFLRADQQVLALLQALQKQAREFGEQMGLEVQEVAQGLKPFRREFRQVPKVGSLWVRAQDVVERLGKQNQLRTSEDWERWTRAVGDALELQDSLFETATSTPVDTLLEGEIDGSPITPDLGAVLWKLGQPGRTKRIQRMWTSFWDRCGDLIGSLDGLSQELYEVQSQISGKQNRGALALLVKVQDRIQSVWSRAGDPSDL